MEVSPSVESNYFIDVIERFTCRREHPKLIRSDCGTNFKGVTNELKKEIEKMVKLKIDESLRRKQVKWEFNPPESPHMGGVWERMVRSVKTALNAIVLDEMTFLNDFSLMTILSEVEALVNSRPLTPVSDDINMEALTPNQFIMGIASVVLPTCVALDDNITPRRRWKQVQSTANQFWSGDHEEKRPGRRPGDDIGRVACLLEVVPRRIIQTWPGRNNIIRKVEVFTKNGRSKGL